MYVRRLTFLIIACLHYSNPAVALNQCSHFFSSAPKIVKHSEATSFNDLPRELETFNSQSAIAVSTDIRFNLIETEPVINLLKDLNDRHNLQQISFEIFNTTKDFMSAPAIEVSPKNKFKKRLRTRKNSSFHEVEGMDAQSPFLVMSDPQVSENVMVQKDIINSMPKSFREKLATIIKKTTQALLSTKGLEYKAYSGYFMLRITSDEVGHKVDQKAFGHHITGLHTHHVDMENSYEFTLPIEGRGTLFLKNDILREIKAGQVLLFGGQAEHGSPDSNSLRLIVVGNLYLQKK